METDHQLFLAVNEFFSARGWEHFFTTVTRLGNGWVLAALIVPAFLLFDRKSLKRHLIPMAVSVALGGLFVAGAKVAVDRPRPAEHFKDTDAHVNTPAGTPSDRSFPSGHTQTAFGTAAYLSCMYPAGTPVFAVLAALVGLSRVAIGVHYPADVLVGALVGTLFGVVGFRLNRRRLER